MVGFERWLELDWGLLADKNYYLRAINPFLFPLYTQSSIILILIGTCTAIFQARAFLPFAILLPLTLNYDKLSPNIKLGCYLWTFLNIIYIGYTFYK